MDMKKSPVLSNRGSLVREGGVEPPRPFGHTDLNRARLPIPPLARIRFREATPCYRLRTSPPDMGSADGAGTLAFAHGRAHKVIDTV